MSEVATIAVRRAYIMARIEHWYNMLNMLQETCDHANVHILRKSSTGNYDPSSDAYWSEFSCPDCGKFWIEEC